MNQRDTPSNAKTIAELEEMTRDELVKQHDWLASDGRGTNVDIAYYLNELSRRTLERQRKRMERLTGRSSA